MISANLFENPRRKVLFKYNILLNQQTYYFIAKKEKKKTGGKNTQKNTEYIQREKKGLNDPDNHDGVITHLEPDILQCEVKWALESFTMTKLVEVMEFQLSYFKSKKKDAVKVLHSIM